MEEEDFSSDSSDEDYVPTEGAAVSEEENSGEDEEELFAEEKGTKRPKKKSKKEIKKKPELVLGKRKGGIKLEGEVVADQEPAASAVDKPVEVLCSKGASTSNNDCDKKKTDALWADFLKDVGGPKPKPKIEPPKNGIQTKSAPETKSTQEEEAKVDSKDSKAVSSSTSAKVTIVKEFDFAGETVKISKEVDSNSKEAQEELKRKQTPAAATSQPTAASSSLGIKRPSGGGLSSVLGLISKKPKISVLEKSKHDWDGFKKNEGIEADLKIHNRGKEGYLERVAFLQRTDERQYELERDLRLSKK